MGNDASAGERRNFFKLTGGIGAAAGGFALGIGKLFIPEAFAASALPEVETRMRDASDMRVTAIGAEIAAARYRAMMADQDTEALLASSPYSMAPDYTASPVAYEIEKDGVINVQVLAVPCIEMDSVDYTPVGALCYAMFRHLAPGPHYGYESVVKLMVLNTRSAFAVVPRDNGPGLVTPVPLDATLHNLCDLIFGPMPSGMVSKRIADGEMFFRNLPDQRVSHADQTKKAPSPVPPMCWKDPKANCAGSSGAAVGFWVVAIGGGVVCAVATAGVAAPACAAGAASLIAGAVWYGAGHLPCLSATRASNMRCLCRMQQLGQPIPPQLLAIMGIGLFDLACEGREEL